MARRILIVAAMPRETAPLRRRLAVEGTNDAIAPANGIEGWRVPPPSGSGPALEVLVAHCGVGREAVLSWLATGIPQQPWSQVIVVGYAGALDPELNSNQVVWGLNGGSLDPTSGGDRWEANSTVPAQVPDTAGDSAVLGSVWTVQEPLLTVAAKRAAWDALGRPVAALVDMETADLVAGFEAAGLEVSVCRVVTDTASESLPAIVGGVRPDGTLPFAALIAALLRRPWLIVALLRLGLRSRASARCLARAVPRAWSAS